MPVQALITNINVFKTVVKGHDGPRHDPRIVQMVSGKLRQGR